MWLYIQVQPIIQQVGFISPTLIFCGSNLLENQISDKMSRMCYSSTNRASRKNVQNKCSIIWKGSITTEVCYFYHEHILYNVYNACSVGCGQNSLCFSDEITRRSQPVRLYQFARRCVVGLFLKLNVINVKVSPSQTVVFK